MTTAYCTKDDVRPRLAGDVPNMGTGYDVTLAAKCDEVSADIDRMVAQARGISGAWSFVADATASERLFVGRPGGIDFLPIDDCVEVTTVAIYSSTGTLTRTLVVGTDVRPLPLNGGLPITALWWPGGAWPEKPFFIGVTAKWGYGLATPVDVREAAIIEVIRSYLGDRAGNDDRLGITPFGAVVTAKAFTSKLKQLVSDYSMGAGPLR